MEEATALPKTVFLAGHKRREDGRAPIKIQILGYRSTAAAAEENVSISAHAA